MSSKCRYAFAQACAFATLVLCSAGRAQTLPTVPLLVPAHYPSIQAAVDAARSGDTIQVVPGIYIEQLQISKSVTIAGAGTDATVIKAPYSLKRNLLKETSIVEVSAGAKVRMTGLTVAGPGSGTCKKGALKAGIRVHGQAQLEFTAAAVRDIQDTPLAPCFRSGTGILVGQPAGAPAFLVVDRAEITQYQSSGIVVLGAGSIAAITRSTVTGPGTAGNVATDGIELVAGAVGTISRNVVSGNICPVVDPGCGPDWFTQFQHAGILADSGAGTRVTGNIAQGNQIGIFLGQVDEVSDNRMLDNSLFGLALFDGTFIVEGGVISGGGAGLWAIAQGANTVIELRNVGLSRLGGPSIVKLECCDFSANVTIGP